MHRRAVRHFHRNFPEAWDQPAHAYAMGIDFVDAHLEQASSPDELVIVMQRARFSAEAQQTASARVAELRLVHPGHAILAVYWTSTGHLRVDAIPRPHD